MTSKKPQRPHRKRADRLTTEEAMQRLFPKKVREAAKEAAEEADRSKKSTIKEDST